MRVRLAVLGGSDECFRPYIARGNALFAKSTSARLSLRVSGDQRQEPA